MNGLKYRILWVDDNIETFIELGVDEEFSTFLKNYGFDPDIVKSENAESALEFVKNNGKFDLILSDLNLAGGEQGNSLIEKIREGEIYTEILFYSAQSDFETIAKQLYQDRVSFFSLQGDEGNRQFKDKVKKLINQTISKLQELSNIRGLVMTETSQLDVMIEDILLEIMTNDTEQTAQHLREYMCSKIKENNDKRIEMYSGIEKMAHEDIIRNRTLFDANKKSRMLNEFLKTSEMVKDDESFKNFHINYEKEVLSTRNDFAHAKSNIIDGIEYLVLSRKDGEQPIKIDQPQCTQIRMNLRKYSEILNKIRGKVFVG